MPDHPTHDRERIFREVVGRRYSRSLQTDPFGDGNRFASTVRLAYCRAAILGKREQRWIPVFSDGWNDVVEPRKLAHQEPVNTSTADACHRVYVGPSYSVEDLSFDWHGQVRSL